MKLFDWLRGTRAPEPETPEREHKLSDEARLTMRIARATEGVPLGDEDWAAIERLRARGNEQGAIELLRRFVAAQPSDLDATLRLCELLCGRLDHTAARAFLERLSGSAPHRERALLLLGEEAERAGELPRAAELYERVLARNIDHPRARAATERLATSRRARREEPKPPPTLEGAGGVAVPVSGRYRLIDELGRGASGTVYRAEDVPLAREVALKILHPHTPSGGDPIGARLRAWQEARVAATLRHPGVAAIYDLDEERQIIAMELCAGGSLRERLLGGPLSPTEAMRALAQLADVLAAAHARGVIHGDVKPANLLLRRGLGDAHALDEDELVLCDFGVARLSDDTAPAVEQRAARGTLAYMAPEQRRGVLTPAADVYASGVVAVELLGGAEALAPWLGDRAALLRGELRDAPSLAVVWARTPSRVAGEVEALLRALHSPEAAARPSAAEVASRARSLAAQVGVV